LDHFRRFMRRITVAGGKAGHGCSLLESLDVSYTPSVAASLPWEPRTVENPKGNAFTKKRAGLPRLAVALPSVGDRWEVWMRGVTRPAAERCRPRGSRRSTGAHW